MPLTRINSIIERHHHVRRRLYHAAKYFVPTDLVLSNIMISGDSSPTVNRQQEAGETPIYIRRQDKSSLPAVNTQQEAGETPHTRRQDKANNNNAYHEYHVRKKSRQEEKPARKFRKKKNLRCQLGSLETEKNTRKKPKRKPRKTPRLSIIRQGEYPHFHWQVCFLVTARGVPPFPGHITEPKKKVTKGTLTKKQGSRTGKSPKSGPPYRNFDQEGIRRQR